MKPPWILPLVAFIAGLVAGGAGWALLADRGVRPPVGLEGAADGSPVVVRVGAETVTLAQFDHRWQSLAPDVRTYHAERGGRGNFAREIADELLLAREARHRGLDRELGVAESMRSCGNRTLVLELLAREVGAKAIPESELRRFYETNIAVWSKPARVQAIELVVTTAGHSGPNDDTPDRETALVKARELRQLVLDGSDAGELAKVRSEAPSSAYGGLVGWVTAGRFARAYEESALALQPGGTSEVIETEDGYVVLHALAREEATSRPFEDVRGNILAALVAEDEGAVRRRYRVFLDELMAGERVEIDEKAVGTVDPRPANEIPAALPPIPGGPTG